MNCQNHKNSTANDVETNLALSDEEDTLSAYQRLLFSSSVVIDSEKRVENPTSTLIMEMGTTQPTNNIIRLPMMIRHQRYLPWMRFYRHRPTADG